MAELGATLAPADNFSTVQLARSFREQFVLAIQVFIDDFAVVQHGFDFVRRGFGTESKRTEGRPARAASRFFARQERGTERSSCITRDRLHVNVAETAPLFECSYQQNILKNAARQTKRVRSNLFAKVFGQV